MTYRYIDSGDLFTATVHSVFSVDGKVVPRHLIKKAWFTPRNSRDYRTLSGKDIRALIKRKGIWDTYVIG